MPQTAITDRSPQSPPYKRHRPEQTLLYQIIERHYPEFRDVMAMQGKPLPMHVQQEFADYLKCGRLEHGFITGILPFTPSGQLKAVQNRCWRFCRAQQQAPGRCDAG